MIAECVCEQRASGYNAVTPDPRPSRAETKRNHFAMTLSSHLVVLAENDPGPAAPGG
jgi:hypothetical protein